MKMPATVAGLIFVLFQYNLARGQLVTVSGRGTEITWMKEVVSDTNNTRCIISFNNTLLPADTLSAKSAKGLFFFPIGNSRSKLTSSFGLRIHPILGTYRFHSGIDIRANYEPVYAFANGIVAETGYDNLNGNYCKINHGNAIETIYAHLSQLFVRSGDHVKGGDMLGISGATGAVTRPHLHFGIKYKGAPVNPKHLYK